LCGRRGKTRTVPPCALMKELTFPELIGSTVTYIFAHIEPITLSHSELVKEKRVKRIVVRGV